MNDDIAAAAYLLYTEHSWTVGRISALFGVSNERISHVITGRTYRHITGGINASRRSREATEYRVTIIEMRLGQRWTYQRIADELGITRQAVYKLIKNHKIGAK